MLCSLNKLTFMSVGMKVNVEENESAAAKTFVGDGERFALEVKQARHVQRNEGKTRR